RHFAFICLRSHAVVKFLLTPAYAGTSHLATARPSSSRVLVLLAAVAGGPLRRSSNRIDNRPLDRCNLRSSRIELTAFRTKRRGMASFDSVAWGWGFLSLGATVVVGLAPFALRKLPVIVSGLGFLFGLASAGFG